MFGRPSGGRPPTVWNLEVTPVVWHPTAPPGLSSHISQSDTSWRLAAAHGPAGNGGEGAESCLEVSPPRVWLEAQGRSQCWGRIFRAGAGITVAASDPTRRKGCRCFRRLSKTLQKEVRCRRAHTGRGSRWCQPGQMDLRADKHGGIWVPGGGPTADPETFLRSWAQMSRSRPSPPIIQDSHS